MAGEIYTISYGGYTPTAPWTEDNPKEFKHAAALAAKIIRESDDREFPRIWHELTVWGGSLEVVTVSNGKVLIDKELEPVEGPYIAVAITRALHERSARFLAETGQTVDHAWILRAGVLDTD